MASVMAPAIDLVTSVVFKSTNRLNIQDKSQYAHFSVGGKKEKFSGWRGICEVQGKGGSKSKDLPVVFQVGEEFEAKTGVLEKKTEPPSRFTEAALIKALEKLGIGRPSTYASILENIKKRKYIKLVKPKSGKQKVIFPTEIGEAIVNSLDSMNFMNLDYTRILESSLDSVAKGKLSYVDLVSAVYGDIKEQSKSIEISTLVESNQCPKCKKPVKRLKSKQKGANYFWVHVDENHDCIKFLSDNEGIPFIREKLEIIEDKCPKCGLKIRRWQRKDKTGFFWAHADSKHQCTQFIQDENGKPRVD